MVLRLVMNVPNLTNSAPIFHQCGVMPIQNWVKFRTVTVYKSLNGLTPDYMKNFFFFLFFFHEEHVWIFFKYNNKVPTRLSTTNSLYIPKLNLCVSRRALRYSGSTFYNTLDLSTQSCSSLSSFKHRDFKHFMWTCMFLIVFKLLFLSVCI